jgi:hypothetical protein
VNGHRRELTSSERAEVLPAVKKYLARVWWLGIFPKSYEVEFMSGAQVEQS